MTSLTIPATRLNPGTRDFGPTAIPDGETLATITIDRTVTQGGTQGLNGQPDTTRINAGIYQSNDGGANWVFRAAAGFIGGIYPSNPAGDPYLASTVTVELLPGTGRQAKATIVTVGAQVTVAGTLNII